MHGGFVMVVEVFLAEQKTLGSATVVVGARKIGTSGRSFCIAAEGAIRSRNQCGALLGLSVRRWNRISAKVVLHLSM